MKPISFSQKKTIFKNKHLDLYSVTADFGSFDREYFVVEKGTRAGVLINRDNSFLLVKQYRYVINDFSWELPSGGIEKGETLEEAAIRECREETGITCRKITPLFDFILSADVADSPAYIFTCSDFVHSGDFDRREIVETKWIPYQKCMHMIMSREIKDVFTIIGLFAYGNSRVDSHYLNK